MVTRANLRNNLANSVAGCLWQGVDLLEKIDDGLYTTSGSDDREDRGTVGAHFRHCLEFVNCFLAGAIIGRIDYDSRARNARTEIEREYAITKLLQTIRGLEQFSSQAIGGALLVRPEDLADDELWCASSPERELEFLRSHTVHHYALIGQKLRARDFVVPTDFGVAPSTLRSWEAQTLEWRQIRHSEGVLLEVS